MSPKPAVLAGPARPLDIDVAERAILFGLTTAAFIARRIGWPMETFMRAAVLSWKYKKTVAEPGRQK